MSYFFAHYIIVLEFLVILFKSFISLNLYRSFMKKILCTCSLLVIMSMSSTYANEPELKAISTATIKAIQGQYTEAIQDFDKIINFNPNSAKAYLARGFVKSDLQQYTEAIQDLDKAISLNPQYTEAYYLRGLAKNELQQYTEAIKDFDKAISLNPQLTNAYFKRGSAEFSLQQYTEAIKDFDKVISLNPQYTGAYCYRGLAKSELQQYTEAIKDFNKAISLNPNSVDAYIGKANLFINMKSYYSALEIYEKIIAIAPNNPEYYKIRDLLLGIIQPTQYHVSNKLEAVNIYKDCVDSTLFILTNKTIGSGVVVKEDGTFITCYHVIDGATSIFVKTNSGKVYKVNGYRYLNKEQDIAILTLDTSDTFKPIKIPIHQSPNIGSKVYTISNPEGTQFTFTDGILSQEYKGILQFTAPISPGSSGGALLDEHGHLIGIINSQIKNGQNINFATANELYQYYINNTKTFMK